MIDTVLAFDTDDSDLGSFFSNCKSDMEQFFEKLDCTVDIICDENLTDLSIKSKLEALETCIFAAYSHGGEDCLVVSATTPYISTELNNTLFGSSFFYTWSCSTAIDLGLNLIENNCLCFIGYKGEVGIWSTEHEPFMIAANHGLKLFFKNIGTEEIILLMKEEYDNQIDELYKFNFLAAAILIDNRDALTLYGKNITISELIIEK